MSQLHIEKITPMSWHDVEDLHVGKDQNFLADNVSSLALAGVIREAEDDGEQCYDDGFLVHCSIVV